MGLVLGPQEQGCQQRAMMDTHGKGEETTQEGEWTPASGTSAPLAGGRGSRSQARSAPRTQGYA